MIGVAPAARLGSVQPNAASPCRERTVSIALRSSVKCAARTTLERGVKVWSVNTRLNRAVTARAWSISTVQGPAPLQAPLHPANAEPAPGTAVKVTDVPDEKVALQKVLHARPAGVLVTVPVPPPETVAVSPNVVDDVNVAVTVVALVGVRVHVPVPAQPPPDQPVKMEPTTGAAVSVTLVPAVKAAEQPVPQLMPAGALVTVPLPVRVTVSVTGAVEAGNS